MFRSANGPIDTKPRMSYKSLSKAKEFERRGLNTQIIIEETVPTAVDEGIQYSFYPLDKKGRGSPELPPSFDEHPTLSGSMKK